jgi:hypothetical protein
MTTLVPAYTTAAATVIANNATSHGYHLPSASPIVAHWAQEIPPVKGKHIAAVIVPVGLTFLVMAVFFVWAKCFAKKKPRFGLEEEEGVKEEEEGMRMEMYADVRVKMMLWAVRGV